MRGMVAETAGFTTKFLTCPLLCVPSLELTGMQATKVLYKQLTSNVLSADQSSVFVTLGVVDVADAPCVLSVNLPVGRWWILWGRVRSKRPIALSEVQLCRHLNSDAISLQGDVSLFRQCAPQ